jgi:shikimate dehydrogenase
MTTPLYAVFGHPIAHSRSPFIHARFGEQTGIALRYVAIDAPPEQFMEILWDFREAGGRGANVTLPLKEYAAGHCAELSEAAARAGAVNTLIRRADGQWRGDNTDGVGLRADLARLQVPLAGRTIVVLGAGGATRGILAPLLTAGPARLHIANRTPEKAEELALHFAALGPVTGGGLDTLAALGPADLLIQATSATRGGALPELPEGLIGPQTIAYDLGYGAAAEPFLALAPARGAAAAHDGLGMLVGQAAESFRLWHGVRPDTAPVLAELRALLAGG